MTETEYLMADLQILNDGRISRYGTVSVLSKRAPCPSSPTTRVVVYHRNLLRYGSRNYHCQVGASGIDVVNQRKQIVATIDIQSLLDLGIQRTITVSPGGYLLPCEGDRRAFLESLHQAIAGKMPDLLTNHPFVTISIPPLVGKEVVVVELSPTKHIVFNMHGRELPHKVTYPLDPEKWGKHLPALTANH